MATQGGHGSIRLGTAGRGKAVMVWCGTAGRGKAVKVRWVRHGRRGKAVRVRLGRSRSGAGVGHRHGKAVEVRRGTLWFGKVWRSRCGAVRRGLFWRGMARLGGHV
jgi:hypothetical protein